MASPISGERSKSVALLTFGPEDFFCWSRGRDCLIYYRMISSILGFYPEEHPPPHNPYMADVPYRTKLSSVENHCFIGTKGPIFSVLDMSHYPSLSFIHSSYIGLLCCSSDMSVCACVHTSTLHIHSFWNVLSNIHMASHAFIDILNLSCVMSAFPTRIALHEDKIFTCFIHCFVFARIAPGMQ